MSGPVGLGVSFVKTSRIQRILGGKALFDAQS